MADRQHWQWQRRCIAWLRSNSSFLHSVLFPLSIWLVDLVLRFSLSIDLADAGADMSLLALSTCYGMLVDGSYEGSSRDGKILQVSTAIFAALWIICLMLVSNQSPICRVVALPLAIRTVIAWIVGLSALVLGSTFLSVLTEADAVASSGTAP